MGRSNRQSVAGSDTRPDWTETHPDRKHWTPHQRALAGMMTEEAYNGLYGRGPAREEEARAAGPASELSDAELLEKLSEIGANGLLYYGGVASNPDKNSREYRVLIGLSNGDSQLEYEARAEWGPKGAVGRQGRSLYRGQSIADAVRAANEAINKKLRDGYKESSFGAASLNSKMVREEAKRMLKER